VATSRPVVVGLDHDSKGFHAVVFGAETRWRSNSFTEPNTDVRRMYACDSFRAFLDLLPRQAHIFAEEPLSLRNGKTNRVLALMAGALWAQGLGRDLFWHWVDIAHWKREVIGKGNASKEEVADWVRASAKKMGPEDRISTYEVYPDLFDAHCLAVYGMRAVPTLELVA
jgi:hypothetical protein